MSKNSRIISEKACDILVFRLQKEMKAILFLPYPTENWSSIWWSLKTEAFEECIDRRKSVAELEEKREDKLFVNEWKVVGDT